MFPRKFRGKGAQSKIKGGNSRVFQIVLWGTEGMPLVGTENLAGRIFFSDGKNLGKSGFDHSNLFQNYQYFILNIN